MARLALIAVLLLFGCGEKKKSGETSSASGSTVATADRATYTDVPPVLTDANIEALLEAHADHGGITKVADLIGVKEDPAQLEAAGHEIARKVGFKDMKEYELVSDRVLEIAGEVMAANIDKKLDEKIETNPVAYSYSKADVDMVKKHAARLKPMIEKAIESASEAK